jgi:hypothetical protein
MPTKHPLVQNGVVRLEAMRLPPPLRKNALSDNGKSIRIRIPHFSINAACNKGQTQQQ